MGWYEAKVIQLSVVSFITFFRGFGMCIVCVRLPVLTVYNCLLPQVMLNLPCAMIFLMHTETVGKQELNLNMRNRK